jgi:hypothetical protein
LKPGRIWYGSCEEVADIRRLYRGTGPEEILVTTHHFNLDS